MTYDPSLLQEDLRRVSEARVLLGHQSVGGNVLEGLQSLSVQLAVPLRIVEIDGLPPDGPGVFHSVIGKNGDPGSKCEVFEYLLNRPERPAYDLAMMKFCYVDLGDDSTAEVSQMLDRYARLVARLQEQRPDVPLMHVTLPLRSDPLEWKTPIKRMLSRSTYEDEGNALRNEFNEGLRSQYAGQPLFDLAAIESTLPDGSRSYFTYRDRPVYTLAAAYTEDGGHLNVDGRRRAAAEFVRIVARTLEQPG